MARLPVPGADAGMWGATLNDYLSVAHNADGTPRNAIVTVASVAALRAMDAATAASYGTVYLKGYSAPGDGGDGVFCWNAASTAADNAGIVVASATPGAGRWIRQLGADGINVKWFGAAGNGVADDAAPIQAAVDYARTLSAGGGGTYRATILLPAGFYRIETAINCANMNGVWLKGAGGRYVNTGFIGCTPDVVLDFTGSTMSGCADLSIFSMNGYPVMSKIGVLFALSQDAQGNQLGGLNCSMTNCFISLADLVGENGGLGSIGVVSIRSEEFAMHDVMIRANASAVFSNEASVAATGFNFTASSSYATIAQGVGSEGVIKILGASFQNMERAAPALLLNGTNSVEFHGYLGRIITNWGTYESAILINQVTYNFQFNGTVESFSRLMHVMGRLENSDVNAVVANQTAPTTEVLNLTDAGVKGSRISVTFGNPWEINGRVLAYHAPVSGGDEPAAGYIMNSELIASQFPDNTLAVSPNLLKNVSNSRFSMGQPFEKTPAGVRKLFPAKKLLGLHGSAPSATVIRFNKADKATTTVQNGGYYRINIQGVLRGGNYGSGGTVTASFTSTVTLNQNNAGTMDAAGSVTALQAKSLTSAGYLDITGIAVAITFAGSNGSVVITPTVTGSGVGEPIYFEGDIELLSDFYVNHAVLFD